MTRILKHIVFVAVIAVALLFSAGIGTGEANNHITSERHIHFGSIEHG